MNLLEHYIATIHNVKLYNVGDSLGQYVKVDITTICYGIKERTTRVFTLSEWGETIEKGYFLA